VQILTSDRVLKAGNAQLKGRSDATYYKEGGLYKYTVGATTDYNEALRLRREVAKKFSGAFIIAFRGDEKMDVNAAIAEWRKKKK
jgi:N-acetylmuramoyl-L-alanine amidase